MCGKDLSMSYFPHSHKFYHYISNRYCIIKTFTIFSITAFLISFICLSKISAADIFSIFNSKFDSHTITMSHNKLTQSFQLKKNIIYNDTLNESSINFYYINDPDSLCRIYIQSSNNDIPIKYIQLFDNTYKEIQFKIHKEPSYLYIDLKTTISNINDKSRIYITIGNNSNDIAKSIKITYTAKKQHTYKKHKKNTYIKSLNKRKKSTKRKEPKKNSSSNKTNATNNKNTLNKKNISNNKNTSNNKKRITKNHSHKKSITRKIQKTKHRLKKNTAKKNVNKLLSVSLSHRFISLKIRECIKIRYYITPSCIHKYKYTWTTSNPETATVSNGKIKALHTGLAIIKIKIKHNNITKTATCTIRITK